MTKEDAFRMAENILLRVYSGDVTCCAIVATAVADKDAWRVVSMLEKTIEFENNIIKTLKQKD